MVDAGHRKIGLAAYGVDGVGEDGPLVLPDRLICKFLIVESEAELCLLFGPVKIFTYHAMLLDKYCSDHVIASAWIKPRELLQVLDRRLRVLGGGWMEFQPALDYLRIFGESTAYGRFHQPSLNRILSTRAVFSPFDIRIDPS